MLLPVVVAACQQSTKNPMGKRTVLKVWAHAGQAAERNVLQDQVRRFNLVHKEMIVQLSLLPERNYNDQVQAAAVAGDLPDLLELDGPYLYNFVWQGHLQALGSLLSQALIDDLLPSIRDQGSYQGKLYGVGVFDSGLALYSRRSVLKKAGISIPKHPKQAWTIQQFNALLAQLSDNDSDGAVLDLKLNYPDEWFSYAFSPALQSAGADLIDRTTYRSAKAVLNSAQAVAAMEYFQAWIQKGKVDLNVDDAAFVDGRVVLSWAGHWEYARYHEKYGEDLVVVPLPDFGYGSRTGQGSWLWTLSQASDKRPQAREFLHFLLQVDEVLNMTAANGAVPGRLTAANQSPLYQRGGDLHLFFVQLSEGYAIPRPKTPAYPAITSLFRRAFANIRNGENIPVALTRAAVAIDQDIQDNQGYPMAVPHKANR